MKMFNAIDTMIQTFLFVIIAFFGILTSFEGGLESMVMIAMYGSIVLGPYQLLSSLITTIRREKFFKIRLIHLITSVVYLTIATLLISLSWEIDFSRTLEAIGVFFGFAIPAVLAFLYYFISVRTFRMYMAEQATKSAAV